MFCGYAARFNSNSQPLGYSGFVEHIEPGAFKRALQENQDVVALYNHNRDYLLGRTASHTLQLREDEKGLYFELTPPDTQLGRDMRELVKRGDIRGMSFSFTPHPKGGESWTKMDGVPHRTLKDVDIHDVSLVNDPAYLTTSVDLRSYEAFLASDPTLSLWKMQLDIASRV